MCNIAGYVGERRAAPVLIDMLRREEGFAGGYYTGIATLHEGKIYYEKLSGDLDRLLSLTRAESLPGNIGVIHTRSKSGGGDKWAHPFVSLSGGEAQCAYIANGGACFFEKRTPEYNNIANALYAEGFDFPCREPNSDDKSYMRLSDGSAIHMSDLMCQLIYRNLTRGADARVAMEEAYSEMPGEIVGLLLSLAEPDSIAWSRINMPAFISFSSHGAYVASTPTAFPADAGDSRLLPALSSGRIYKDSYTASPFKKKLFDLAPIDAHAVAKAYSIVSEELRMGEEKFTKLFLPVSRAFGECDATPREALTYYIIDSLLREGKITVRSVPVEGAFPGLVAPEFRVSLREK